MIAIKLMHFLVLGAIVNVAVAWGCGLRLARAFANQQALPRETMNSLLVRYDCDVAPGVFPVRSRYRACGLTLDEVAWLEHAAFEFENGFIPGHTLNEFRTGWPCHCLCGAQKDGIAITGILRLPANAPFLANRAGYPVPTNPIWPGFAVNTIFYAAVLWLVWITPGFVRWRIRHVRGRCLHCGYDLRGQPADSINCSECGNMVIVKCMGLPPPATPAPETERATT